MSRSAAAGLGGVLEQGLQTLWGKSVRIASLEGEALEAQSTHPVRRLRVVLTSGERLAVVCKRPQPGAGWKGGPREVLIYQRLLAGRRFGAPELYASEYDAARGRYALFLEDVGEQTLRNAEWEEWLAAVRWLAAMHGTYWDGRDGLRSLACLDEHDAGYYRRIAQVARQNLVQAGAGAVLPRFDDLVGAFEPAIAGLVQRPQTLLHGDIFPNNLVVQPGPRIRPIDWEEAAIGLGVWDLARLLDGWGTDKPAFVAAYLDELARYTPVPPDRRDFDRVFRRCEFLNALWHFAWEVDACRDTAFVEESLGEMQTILGQLDGTGSDG